MRKTRTALLAHRAKEVRPMVTELISNHTPVTVRQQFHARSIVETSIGTATVRICECE